MNSSPSSPTAEPVQRDIAPPGQRHGHGTASLVQYLMQALAAKPKVGPPGGIERRRWPRD